MKRTFLLLLAAFSLSAALPAWAEKHTKNYPHAFFGVQGGGQAVLNGYNFGDVLTGTVSAYVGGQWTPVWGTRLHFNGYQSMEGIKGTGTYKFKYLTGTIDLMANLVSAINGRDNNTVDLYLIGGVGANKVWGDNWKPYYAAGLDVKNHLSPTFKLGVLMDVNFTRNVALNIELGFNRHGRHDSHVSVNMSNDWQFTGQLGVKFSFPGKEKKMVKAAEILPAEVIQPVETPAPDPAPEVKAEPKAEKKAPATIDQTLYYALSASTLEGENLQKVYRVAEWLKAHPAATATISGYSDKATGTPAINARVAEQRADNVKQALLSAGIAESRLSVKSYGDTVQPFSDNVQNRCVIVLATEK